MFRFESRTAHYVSLVAIAAVLTLPNLGAPSLWDQDEGLNAEAAREMYESGDWVVPRFNFELRDAKPALLYWCQAGAYHLFGVNEFAARLPSALAALIAVLATYELGRRMFNPMIGWLAGLILVTSLLVVLLAHFANPDSLLLACVTLSFLAFWLGFAPESEGAKPRRRWFVPVGLACGLGMLAKGPVALVIPAGAIILYLVWQRQWRHLWDRRLLAGIAAFILVSTPWYSLVTVQTRGAFARGFFLKNNVQRFLEPMENHDGLPIYHAAALFAGFLPWSILIPATLWFTFRSSRRSVEADAGPRDASRFLLGWVAIVLVLFSIAATKLPNYTLPLYPAFALMTARVVYLWRTGQIQAPAWIPPTAFLILVGCGLTAMAGFRIAGGAWTVVPLKSALSGLADSWWLCLVPVLAGLGALAAWVTYRPRLAVSLICVEAILFPALFAAIPVPAVDKLKAAKAIVVEAGANRRDRDLRLATLQFSQPSIVFYCHREVRPLTDPSQVAPFLAVPTASFLFVPEPVWDEIRQKDVGVPSHALARHWDMYRGCHILVIGNDAARLQSETGFASR